MARNEKPQPDKRKQSVYFPEEMLAEIYAEAKRQGRSMSWILQSAWSVARLTIATYPADPSGRR